MALADAAAWDKDWFPSHVGDLQELPRTELSVLPPTQGTFLSPFKEARGIRESERMGRPEEEDRESGGGCPALGDATRDP